MTRKTPDWFNRLTQRLFASNRKMPHFTADFDGIIDLSNKQVNSRAKAGRSRPRQPLWKQGRHAK